VREGLLEEGVIGGGGWENDHITNPFFVTFLCKCKGKNEH